MKRKTKGGARKKLKGKARAPKKRREAPPGLPPEVQRSLSQAVREMEAEEKIKKAQFGKGNRPIVLDDTGVRYIVVGDDVFASDSYATPADFYVDHMRKVIGEDWFESNRADTSVTHPLILWDREVEQQTGIVTTRLPGVSRLPFTGLTLSYFGLAYGLYRIRDNVVLQRDHVKRLRNANTFQSAYHELMVISWLIAAGFTDISLQDEGDVSFKHQELSARSPDGRLYWVECKMNGYRGVLGVDPLHGARIGSNPTARLATHLDKALSKPALNGTRLIFIELNIPPVETRKSQMELFESLQDIIRAYKPKEEAYVIVSNIPFHWALNSVRPTKAAFCARLGGPLRESTDKVTVQLVRDLVQRALDYPALPDTLDGRPASEAYYGRRVMIGRRFEWPWWDGGMRQGEVIDVELIPGVENKVNLTVRADDGAKHPVLYTLSEEEVADLRRYGPTAYFALWGPGDPDPD